jgi:hypothetical protein
MIIVRRFLEAAPRRSLKPPRTSLSDKDVAALMTAHAVTAVTAVIAATILTGVTLDATTIATIAGMIARLATDEEEGMHLLEEDVAVDVAGVARRLGSMSPARSAARKATRLEIVGGDSRTMMMTLMTRRPMLPRMVLTQTGTRTAAPLITSPGSSTT